MIIEIKVPKLGESASEAAVGNWFVKAGDYVLKDDPICELWSADGDLFKIVAPCYLNTIIKIFVEEGDFVELGDVLCNIDGEVKGAQSAKSAPAQAK